MSCAVMGVLSALMELCGSEGTCRCSGVRVEGLGVKVDSKHWWNVFDIPVCEESRFPLGDLTAGMWLLVMMLLSISELRSGVGSSLAVSALILPSRSLFSNASLMGSGEMEIGCSPGNPIPWSANPLSCLEKKSRTCRLMDSHCGSIGEWEVRRERSTSVRAKAELSFRRLILRRQKGDPHTFFFNSSAPVITRKLPEYDLESPESQSEPPATRTSLVPELIQFCL